MPLYEVKVFFEASDQEAANAWLPELDRSIHGMLPHPVGRPPFRMAAKAYPVPESRLPHIDLHVS